MKLFETFSVMVFLLLVFGVILWCGHVTHQLKQNITELESENVKLERQLSELVKENAALERQEPE